MKKILMGVLLACGVSGLPVWGAQAEGDPSVTISEGEHYRAAFRVGLMHQEGTANEIVFDGPHRVSELTWDIKELMLAGGTVFVTFSDLIQLNAALWIAVNEGRGSMTNYDWFLPGFDWTHFSEGRVDINSAYTVDLNASYRFTHRPPYSFFLILGYKRMSWDWSEYGGRYVYSADGFRDERGDFGGENGIDYEQRFDVPYAGLGLRLDVGRVDVSGYMHYSPLARVVDWDHHLLRGLYFTGRFKNVDYYGFGLEGSLALSGCVFLSLALDAFTIPEARGDMTVRDEKTGHVEFYRDAAGIENVVYALSLLAGLRF